MKLEEILNTVIQGDCLEVMQELPDNCIDLVVTSPPYDNLREYKGYSFDFEGIARELFRIIKDGGVVVWVVADAVIDGSESGTSFKQALYFKEIGFNLHDTMIWHKNSPPLTHNRYEQHFEYMFVFSKGKPKTFNPIKSEKLWKDNRKFKAVRREKDGSYDVGFLSKKEDKIIGNVWLVEVGGGHSSSDKIAYEHPAIFPEKLVDKHISSWSNEGDIILDPFNGSGTTTKMAKHLKRNFIGIDISEKYCEIARQRLLQDILL